MGVQVDIRGEEQLARVAGAIASAMPNDLRKKLLRGIREQAKPAVKDVKATALATLPSSGGLNKFVAKSSIGVRTRTSGEGAGVRIVAKKAGHDIYNLNRGRLRHPLFGMVEGQWFTQEIKPGFFSLTIAQHERRMARGITVELEDLLMQIKRESGT